MILSGSVIEHAVREHRLGIDPFDPALVNPSSYDLTLGDEACVYVQANSSEPTKTFSSYSQLPSAPAALDSRAPNPFLKFRLDPEKGFRVGGSRERYLRRVFLFHTRETIAPGLEHVAVVDGKSSLGRLGLVVHATAGYVDPGFSGQVTLECAALGEDVVVYPGMRIAQVRFMELGFRGSSVMARSYAERGHYVGASSRGPVPSRSHLQFEREPTTDKLPPPPLKLCSVCSGTNEEPESEGPCDNCGTPL